MKISPTSWHYRLYCYMSQAHAAWTHKDDYHEYPKNTAFLGLCPYMRMILIWGPIAILSNLIPIFAILATLFIFPASTGGLAGVLWLFGAIGTLVGAIIGLGYLVEWNRERRHAREESQLGSYGEPEEKPKGFIALLYTWIHDSICPKLELPQDD